MDLLANVEQIRRESASLDWMTDDAATAELFRLARGGQAAGLVELPRLDADLAVLIGVSRNPGDDIAIALDYRTGRDDPRVVASDWWTDPRRCAWRDVAPTFSAFAAALGMVGQRRYRYIAFERSRDGWTVSEISNQSTGYCPDVTSFTAVQAALDNAGLDHPGSFTRPVVFRRCLRCRQLNFVTAPELSWRPFTEVTDVVQVGRRVRGEVRCVDTANGEARLSLRALLPDPARLSPMSSRNPWKEGTDNAPDDR